MNDKARDLYPYANGNLLEDRNRYSYTPFVGAPLIEAWAQERAAILQGLPKPASMPPANVPQNFSPVIGARETDTAALMEWLVEHHERDYDESLVRDFVWRLLDRFENVKRFHDAYNKHFRAVDKTAYENLSLYIRGAEVFLLAYGKRREMTILNVLLKLVDSLCALNHRLDNDEQARLARVIEEEAKIVQNLMAAKNSNHD